MYERDEWLVRMDAKLAETDRLLREMGVPDWMVRGEDPPLSYVLRVLIPAEPVPPLNR